MRFSENFERDYNFYLNNVEHFTFCGTHPKFKAIPNGIKSAKEVFYKIDSTGKNEPTSEPELLDKLLLCKASVNFHIKQWAEGRADGTLPNVEFSEDCRLKEIQYFESRNLECENLKKIKTYESIYGFPKWVIEAVEKQKANFYK